MQAVGLKVPRRPCCPRTVQIDAHTLGTLFYDLSTEQWGPGLYVVRAHLAAFGQE